MGTTSVTDDLDPLRRGCLSGCHSGSVIRSVHHEAKQSGLTLGQQDGSHRADTIQAHQQLKEELGLDYYEGRSWRGLHHHALLCQMAMVFLQSLRIGEKGAAAATKPGWQDRRYSRACPSCAVASSLPCPATSNAARAATTACPGTCCYELAE